MDQVSRRHSGGCAPTALRAGTAHGLDSPRVRRARIMAGGLRRIVAGRVKVTGAGAADAANASPGAGRAHAALEAQKRD
jgi:hypothetical protein